MTKRHHRDLERLARRYGRRLNRTGNHMRLVDPVGRAPDIIVSSTPKNRHHALENVRRDLERSAYLPDPTRVCDGNSDCLENHQGNHNPKRNDQLRPAEDTGGTEDEPSR